MVIKKDQPFSLANTRVYPISLPIKIYQEIIKYKNHKNELFSNINATSSWNIISVNPKYDNYILVIGESMRMDYLSSYGFPLETTPFLNTTKGKFYQGYISASANTFPALKYSLYQYNNNQISYENNLISLAKKAGFETVWLSNQGFLGDHDTIAAKLAVQSDNYYFPTKGDYLHKFLDNHLLDKLNIILSKPHDKKRLIIIHLLGSHPYFCDRLWQKVEFNYINKKMSCYLQSIKQTDSLLKEINDKLKQYTTSYSLLYFSDHGLSFINKDNKNNTTLAVGNHTKENYQVPLFVISSDDTTRQYINFQQSATNFLVGFAEWTGIQLAEQTTEPFWQGTSKKIKVYNWFEWIDFDNLNSDPAIMP